MQQAVAEARRGGGRVHGAGGGQVVVVVVNAVYLREARAVTGVTGAEPRSEQAAARL